MHRRGRLGFLLALLILLLPSCGGDDVVSLRFSGTATGDEVELTNAALRRFMDENPEIRVYVVPTPRYNEERLSVYTEQFEQGEADADVYQIDVVWTKALAAHAFDLKPYISDDELQRHFPVIVENNSVDGKLVALPWFTDAPVLYYRSDLLEKYGYEKPPSTWDELEAMALKIQQGERDGGNLGFWGYIWQGRPYEGLTCNAVEWQSSQGGGNILDDQGGPAFNNPEAAKAFQRAAKWVGTISPPQVVEMEEEDSRSFWTRGDVAFMRNWSYAYSQTKATALANQFGVAPMPRGEGGPAAVLGGWQLMVSQYSAHPEAAVRLVKYLASEKEQKIRALEGSQNPTLMSLYDDPEILEEVPFFSNFDTTMEQVIRRPSNRASGEYPRISEAYWNTVHSILTGGDAQEALAKGEARVNEILGQ